MPLSPKTHSDLTQHLRHRLSIIANHTLRSENPAEQLRQLSEVSQQIDAIKTGRRSELPTRLRHYLDQASYQKALAWLEDTPLGTESD